MIKYINKNILTILLVITLCIMAVSIIDKNYYIGGDVMFPLNPPNNIYKMFAWNAGQESQHSLHFFWYMYYYLFDYVGIPSYISHKILVLTLLIVGFVFTRLLFKCLFAKKIKNLELGAFAAAAFYTFNPVYYLVVDAYLPLYGFPVCLFFLTKYLKEKRIVDGVLFSLFINVFFFVDLPQVKQLIVFAISVIFILVLYSNIYSEKLVDLVKKSLSLALLALGLNLWAIVPFLCSFFTGAISEFSGNLAAYGGYADLNTASVFYIIRFFNSAIISIYPKIGNYLTSWYFIFWTFFLQGLLLLGLLIFRRDKKTLKSYLILLIAFLLFVFVAKGPNSPLGVLYRFLVVNIPYARIFRTTSYVSIGSAVFYALALGLITTKIKEVKWGKDFVNAIIIVHIAVFFPMYLGFKFYTPLSQEYKYKGYKIPKDYWNMGKTLDSIKTDSKVMLLPLPNGYTSKKWGYVGADLITWMSNKELVNRPDEYGLTLDNKTKLQTNQNLYDSFVFNNVSHILLQKDSVGVPIFNPDQTFKIIEDNKYFALYEVPPEKYLPKVYIPTRTLFVQSGLADIQDVIGFEGYDIRSQLYYKNPKVKDRPPEFPVTSAIVDEIFVILREQTTQISPKTLTWHKGWAWPEANTSPTSMRYYAVKLNELKEIYLNSNTLDKVDVYIWLSAKRSVELTKFDLESSMKEKLIDNYADYLGEVDRLLSSVKEEEYDTTFWGIVRKASVYTNKSKEAILSTAITPSQREEVSRAYNELKEWVDSVANPDCIGHCYKFTVPKTGAYDVYLDVSEIVPTIEKLPLKLNVEGSGGNFTKNIDGDIGNGWQNIGTAYLKPKQDYKYDFSLPKQKSLVNVNNIENPTSEEASTLDLQSQAIITDVLTSGKTNGMFNRSIKFTPIEDWFPSKEYKISFDYFVSAGYLGFAVVEESPDYIKSAGNKGFDQNSYPLNYKTTFAKEFTDKTKEEDLSSEEVPCSYTENNECYKTFEQIVKAGKDASRAFVVFYSYANDNSLSNSKVKNVSVTRHITPKMALRFRGFTEMDQTTIPAITYTRVNPSKYIIRVENAYNPYSLVLGENFSRDWKVFYASETKFNKPDNLQASYFNGQIREGAHSNLFWYKGMFETWTLSPISTDTHFIVNGYANSWEITPEETNHKNKYYLVIEYLPQKIQYAGIILWGAFIVCLISVLVVNKIRSRHEI